MISARRVRPRWDRGYVGASSGSRPGQSVASVDHRGASGPVSAPTQVAPAAPPAPSSRPYLYALDPLRGITALVVILVHVLIFVDFHWQSVRAQELQAAGIAVTHVTRNVFMFLTAITLSYVYAGRPLPLGRFWSRRGVGVLLPYCIWTIVYAWINTPEHAAGHVARIVARDLVTGGASYQLY